MNVLQAITIIKITTINYNRKPKQSQDHLDTYSGQLFSMYRSTGSNCNWLFILTERKPVVILGTHDNKK